jgi:hypothetical protein
MEAGVQTLCLRQWGTGSLNSRFLLEFTPYADTRRE